MIGEEMKIRSGLMHPKKMQEYNAYLVLQLIKNNGPLSRADISRALNCSRSAVSSIINWLEDYNLTQVVGIGNPRTGQKSKLLSFNPKAYCLAAVDIKLTKKTFALVDLAGDVITLLKVKEQGTNPVQSIKSIVKNMDILLRKSGIHLDMIKGLGITIPGIVDTEKGNVIYSSSLSWDKTVNISEELAKRINIPVHVVNDANALALGEAWVGKGSSYSDVAYIFAGRGVGGAYIHNNEIFKGTDYAFAEFGKIIISSPDGPIRAEEALSFSRILSLYKKELDATTMTDEEITEMILEIIQQKNNKTKKIIERILDKLSQLIATIVAILNPEAIILNCPYVVSEKGMLDVLNRKVIEYLPMLPRRTVNIMLSSLGEKCEVIGGAAVALSKCNLKIIINGKY